MKNLSNLEFVEGINYALVNNAASFVFNVMDDIAQNKFDKHICEMALWQNFPKEIAEHIQNLINKALDLKDFDEVMGTNNSPNLTFV